MIIRRVRLEGFRCFTAPTEVGPFGERLTVVHGPNAIGKSTLMQALERTFFDRPESQSAEMDALVPWGTDVLPRVTVDFSSGGDELRIEKVFGGRGSARLSRREGKRPEATMVAWKEGTIATEWLREQFGARQPARGATRPEHRGLAQVLFVQQGQLELPDKLGDGAVERLRALVGQATVDGTTRALEDQLRKRHEQLFTAGGQPKKGAPLSTAREQLSVAEAEHRAALAAWQGLDALAAQLAAATGKVSALNERRHSLSEERDRLQPQVKLWRALSATRDEARRARDAAEQAFKVVAERIQAIADLRLRTTTLEARVAELAAADAQAADAVTAAEAKASAASASLEAHGSGRTALREARERAGDARRLATVLEELGELGPRIEGVAGTRAEVAALEAALAASPGHFSGQRIKALRELLDAERANRALLDSLRIRVKVRAVTDTTMDGERLRAGETRELSAEGTLTVSVGGAELAIAGPAVDLAAAREAHARSHAEAEALAQSLGSHDPSELEVWRARHKDLESQLKVKRERLQGLLRAEETSEALVDRLTAHQATRDRILAARPDFAAAAPEPHRLEAEVRESEARFEREHDALTLAAEGARKAAQAAARAREAGRAALAAAENELTAARSKLELTCADGLSEGDREARRRALSIERQKADDTLAIAEAALAPFEADPDVALERCQRALDGLAEELAQRQADQVRCQSDLAHATRAAPYAELARTEERVAVLEAEVARARLDAEALHLLWTMFEEEHAHVTARLVGPVVGRVVPRLKKLAGPRFEGLAFDESFRPSGVRVRGAAQPVALDALSYGTRDQLSLLVRLALAEIVAGSTPLPVVLDDPLVHADKTRLRRLLSLFEETSHGLQVIVLTCRPEDYRALGAATFLDLAAQPDLFTTPVG